MSTGDKYVEMYRDYYKDGRVTEKREIAARQSLDHIQKITYGQRYARILDVGAGNGAMLQAFEMLGGGERLSAVEISRSGIDEIKARNLKTLDSVLEFDGYKIPHPDKSFDLGTAVHVLEHVEHERLFLKEMARVCRNLYIEVPLELTRDLAKAVRMSGPFGHINFYTDGTLHNLLITSGLTVKALTVFHNDLEYEVHLAGSLKGTIKHIIKKGALRYARKFAMRRFVYLGGALCTND